MRLAILGLVLFSATVFAQKPSFRFSLSDTLQPGDTLDVKVTINKTGIYGFAKLELYVPPGFTPLIDEAQGASIVFRDETLKYIWIEMPSSSEIKFSVRFATDIRLSGKKEIYGRFHYLAGGKRQSEKLPVQSSFINNPGNSALPEPLLAMYGKKYNAAESTVLLSDTVYRVQIGAFKKRLGMEILSEFCTDTSGIHEEQTGGYFKYSVGEFSSMPEASEFRDICGVRGAFVVRYVKGIRK